MTLIFSGMSPFCLGLTDNVGPSGLDYLYGQYFGRS